jgi:hypothetical protein
MRVRDEHVKHWLDHGYTVVNDFLTPQELAVFD